MPENLFADLLPTSSPGLFADLVPTDSTTPLFDDLIEGRRPLGVLRGGPKPAELQIPLAPPETDPLAQRRGTLPPDWTTPARSPEELAGRNLQARLAFGLPSEGDTPPHSIVEGPEAFRKLLPSEQTIQNAQDTAKAIGQMFLAAGKEDESPESAAALAKSLEELRGPDQPPGTSAKVTRGLIKAGLNIPDQFLSPLGLATLGSGALPQTAQRLVSAGFTVDMLRNTPQAVQAWRQAVEAKDPEAIAETSANLATHAVMTYAVGRHAVEPAAKQQARKVAEALDLSEQEAARLMAQPEYQTRVNRLAAIAQAKKPPAFRAEAPAEAKPARLQGADFRQPIADLESAVSELRAALDSNRLKPRTESEVTARGMPQTQGQETLAPPAAEAPAAPAAPAPLREQVLEELEGRPPAPKPPPQPTPLPGAGAAEAVPPLHIQTPAPAAPRISPAAPPEPAGPMIPAEAAAPPAPPKRKRPVGEADRQRIEQNGWDLLDELDAQYNGFPNPLPGARVMQELRQLETREKKGRLEPGQFSRLNEIRSNIRQTLGPHWLEMIAPDSPLWELRRRGVMPANPPRSYGARVKLDVIADNMMRAGYLREGVGQGSMDPVRFAQAVLDTLEARRNWKEDRGRERKMLDELGRDATVEARYYDEQTRASQESAVDALNESLSGQGVAVPRIARALSRQLDTALGLPAGSMARLAQSVRAGLGVELIYVESAEPGRRLPFNGVRSGPAIFVSITTRKIPTVVIGHELGHTLATEFPAQWERIRSLVLPRISDRVEALAERRETYAKAGRQMETRGLEDELVADWVGNHLADERFLNRLAKLDPEGFQSFAQKARGLIRRLATAAKQWLTEGVYRVRMLGGSLQQADTALAKALAELSKTYRTESQMVRAERGELPPQEGARPPPVAEETPFSMESPEGGDPRLWNWPDRSIVKQFEWLDEQDVQRGLTAAEERLLRNLEIEGRARGLDIQRTKVVESPREPDEPARGIKQLTADDLQVVSAPPRAEPEAGRPQPARKTAPPPAPAGPGEVLNEANSSPARSLSPEQSARIGNALVAKIESLVKEADDLSERLKHYGPSTSHNAYLNRELAYVNGQIDALMRVNENFKDTPETRAGEVFFSLEPPRSRADILDELFKAEEVRAKAKAKSDVTAQRAAQRDIARLKAELGDLTAQEGQPVPDSGTAEPKPLPEPGDWRGVLQMADDLAEQQRTVQRRIQETRERGEKVNPADRASLTELRKSERRLRASLRRNEAYVRSLRDELDALPRGTEHELRRLDIEEELKQVPARLLNKIGWEREVERRVREAEAGTPANRTARQVGWLGETLEKLAVSRARFGAWWRGRENRQAMSRQRDWADNAAQLAAHRAANFIRHELNRALDAKPRDVAKADALREAALTMVVEANGDPAALAEFRLALAGAEKPHPKWAAQASEAIAYAQKHWDKLEPVAETYRQLTDQQLAGEQEAGTGTLRFGQGYVFHLQDAGAESVLSQLGGEGGHPGTPFQHIRDYPTYAEAIGAGIAPKTLSAVDLLQARLTAGQKLLNQMTWLKEMRDWQDPTTELPLVKDPIVRLRKDGTEDITAPSGYSLVSRGRVKFAILNGYDGLFSRLTKRSEIRQSEVGKTVQKAFATAKHVTLFFDSFHLGRLAFWQSVITHRPPSYRRGATLLDNTLADIREMAARGEIPQDWVQGASEAKYRLDLAVKAGFNVGNVVDNLHTEWLQTMPGVRQTTGAFNKWLFSQYQRGAMAESWLYEFERVQKANPKLTEQEVAQRVSQDLNARFGNLGRQGMFKSQTMQDLARLVFLAPQWNEALIRSELTGLGQLIKSPVESLREGRLVMGTLGRALGTMAVGQFIANQIINYATRHQATWENPEEGMGAKISAWIPDWIGGGPGYFLNPMALALEISHLAMTKFERTGTTSATLREMLESRLSGPMRGAAVFATGRVGGRSVRPGAETWLEAVKAAAPVPILAGALVPAAKQLVTGENEERNQGQFQRQVMASFGIKADQAPSEERRLSALAREFNSEHGVQESAEFYAGDYSEYTAAIRRGNQREAQAALEELLGKRTPRQIAEHYERWAGAPFTGNKARESQFWLDLTAEQRQAYQAARRRRQQLARSARAKLIEQLRRGASGE